jgi:lipopolysaccharide export system protein LptA
MLMTSLKTYITLASVACVACAAWAQTGTPQKQAAQAPAPQNRRIYLEHANTLNYNKRQSADYQILRGDVRFRQDSAYMYCDSAYFYERTNSMDAFGNVRFEQGDSLYMFSDSLYYDGNTGLARLRDNVRLVHNDAILYTDNLNYERFSDEAYYFDRGVLVDPENHLMSELGWYYPSTKTALFLQDVQLRSYEYKKGQTPELTADGLEVGQEIAPLPDNSDTIPEMQMNRRDSILAQREPPHASLDPDDEALAPRLKIYSDTIRYDFVTGQSELHGPSRIVSDTALILTDLGYYNTKTDFAKLFHRSQVFSTGRFATGDTLYYDRLNGIGEVFGRAEMCDTLNSAKLLGDYVYYNEATEYIMATGHALGMEFSDGDTLYLHADTLKAFTKDSIRYAQAYYAVRYYRSDLQGVCDSLIYSSADSIATFMGQPVMWNESYQITGDTIFIKMADKGVDRAMVHDYAFLIEQKDSSYFNQISGKELVCFFDSSKVRQMDMQGNVKIIYFPEESDHTLIGLNQMIGNYLSVWFNQGKMDKMRIWPEVVGSLTPQPLITPDILYLDNFRWMQYLRPTGPADVFRDVRMKSEDRQEYQQLFDADELNGY